MLRSATRLPRNADSVAYRQRPCPSRCEHSLRVCSERYLRLPTYRLRQGRSRAAGRGGEFRQSGSTLLASECRHARSGPRRTIPRVFRPKDILLRRHRSYCRALRNEISRSSTADFSAAKIDCSARRVEQVQMGVPFSLEYRELRPVTQRLLDAANRLAITQLGR